MVEQVGNGKRILVIEDDPSVRTLVERVLTAYGFIVSAAADGLDGLMQLESGATPDLMIADVMMPRLDGMSLVKALKTRPETAQIPVIFLTAKSDSRSMIEGINAGAKFYITKPFQIDELVGKVRKALGL
jgi:DNA-binding response OmpR family regulator